MTPVQRKMKLDIIFYLSMKDRHIEETYYLPMEELCEMYGIGFNKKKVISLSGSYVVFPHMNLSGRSLCFDFPSNWSFQHEN